MTPTRPPPLLTPFQPTFRDCPNKEQKFKESLFLGQLPEDGSTCLCSQENRDRVKVCEKRALPYATLQKGEWPRACHGTVCLHVENVYELTHSLSSSGNSCLVRTQLNLTLGPSCGRQRLISFPPGQDPVLIVFLCLITFSAQYSMHLISGSRQLGQSFPWFLPMV